MTEKKPPQPQRPARPEESMPDPKEGQPPGDGGDPPSPPGGGSGIRPGGPEEDK